MKEKHEFERIPCNVSENDLFPLIKEALKRDKRVKFTVSGKSMWPWIVHNRDSVLIENAKTDQLRKGDIILYQTESGHHILHRITKLWDGGCITTGDGNLYADQPIPLSSIIGRATTIYRKNKVICCDNLFWKMIFRIWVFLFPIRKHIMFLTAK